MVNTSSTKVKNLFEKMKINIMLSKDSNEKCLIHSKRDNREIMIGFDTEEIIEEIFNSLLHRYRVSLEQSIKPFCVSLYRWMVL